MQALLSQYLLDNSDIQAQKIQYSPVPKGKEGDLALGFFLLAKELKTSPRQIAEQVQKTLQESPLVQKSIIDGPYLNIFFSDQVFFEQSLQTSLTSDLLAGKSSVLEYSGPNTNKPLHLGHMRNHALALAVGNILETAGGTVNRVNIINDRGIHICKSMLAYLKWGNGETPESSGMKSDLFVGKYYIKFDQESKKDESLLQEAQEMLLKWEAKDPETIALWSQMNEWTLQGHQVTYDRQGVNFVKIYKESEYYQEGKNIAQRGLEEGVFEKREDNAIVINFEDEQLGQKVVLRADGTSVYLTQDLAVATARDKDFSHPDEMIYTVADEQNYHFKVLFECLDRLKVIDSQKCFHLSYGLVNLPDGRMKSREGTVVDADDLMNNLAALAQEKMRENQSEFSETEILDISEKLQNAAWKYYLLRTSPSKSITFNPEESIQFNGATGPYLQYAGVRIKSILSKGSQKGFSPLPPQEAASILSSNEKPLGVKILEWPTTLNRAALEKNPTYITTYLTELAQEWSSYYANNSVLQAESEELINARLTLASKVLDVLKKGLHCLSIEIPQKM